MRDEEELVIAILIFVFFLCNYFIKEPAKEIVQSAEARQFKLRRKTMLEL